MSKKETEDTGAEKNKKDNSLRIPLRLVPNEAESLAEEMREIFDEDKITHRHGSAEPERD